MLHHYLFRTFGFVILVPCLIIACTTQTGTSGDTTVTDMTKPAVDTLSETAEGVEEMAVEETSPRDGGTVSTETSEEASVDPTIAESTLAPGVSGEPIPGTTIILQGLYLQYDELDPEFFVIVNEPAWGDFWQTFTPEGQVSGPSIDFNTSFVLVGIQGVKSTGGHQITFTSLEQRGNEVHVIVDLHEPDPDESADMEFTQPYTMMQVEISRLTSAGTLTFIFETDRGQELGRVTQTVPSL